jgi:hypothetical protein
MKRQGQVVPGMANNSQTGVLRREVEAAGIRHGDTARVLVKNVRAEHMATVGRMVFFCQSRVEVLRQIEQGDGQPIPQDLVEVTKVGRVREGYFDLEGTLRSNGRLVLTDLRVRPGSERPLGDRSALFAGIF